MNIYLIGFMGSGKSTLAKEIANTLTLKFMDMDLMIEKVERETINKIFFKKGEKYFRELERQLLIETTKYSNYVIATGGGAPCYRDAMEIMNKNGWTIYLKLSQSALFERLIKERKVRPLIKNLDNEQLKKFITKKLKKREPFYLHSKQIVDLGKEDLKTLYQNIPMYVFK